MRTPKLGKRQCQIYDFINTYTQTHGYPPTVREIGEAVGLASPSTVHVHLKVLERHGLIKRDPNKPRTLEVTTSDTPLAPHAPLEPHQARAHLEFVNLPLVGKVAAGTPILAEENIEEHIKLPVSLVGDQAGFLLEVEGNSMIQAGIHNKDYVVVREQSDAINGDIVVALIDDSATVKTFYREKDHIRLQPENDTMEPIRVVNPIILGKVCALIRRFR